VPPEFLLPEAPPERSTWLACLVAALLGIAGLVVAFHGIALPDWLAGSTWSIAGLLVAVAFLGHVLVEVGSAFTLWATDGDRSLRANLRNPAGFVGLVERPLLLGALAFGQPGFFLLWYTYKAIGRWKGSDTAGRPTFVIHLLHSALSLGAVALAWATWQALGLPVPVSR
jgi:hypothetical protein